MGKKAVNVCVWCITYQETVGNDLPGISHMTKTLASLDPAGYIFQLEKGKETGRLHYQGNLRLKEKMTMSKLRERIKSLCRDSYAKGCLTLTPAHDLRKAAFYCLKEETRVEGPWVFPSSTYLGQDCLTEAKMYPWQKSMFDLVVTKEPHDRHIHFVVDPNGNSGKSVFTKTLAWRHDAVVIPLGLSSAQVKAALTGAGQARLYIVDLPRNNSSWKDVFDTLEEVKRGHVISSFHGKLKTLFMFRPHIVCFSNVQPKLSMLSRDMWKIYSVARPNLELKEQELFVSDMKPNIYNKVDPKQIDEMWDSEYGTRWTSVPSARDGHAIDIDFLEENYDGVIFEE